MPAELFPTRFRCTCHGLAAASGKLGSVIAQCFISFVDFGKGSSDKGAEPENWLGYALLWYVSDSQTFTCLPLSINS